jgi:molybdopterin-containing oxidoreductase family membrane subunit
MVIILMVPLRRALQLQPYISIDHFEAIAKILLFTSLIISYAYLVEYGLAFYGHNQVEMELFRYRALGHYRVLFWLMIICNSLVPLTLFIKRLRRNLAYLFVVALLVNLGMWIERFILIVTSLARDFDPYAWGTYTPSWVEIGITFGSFGLFFMLILLFVKTVPVLSMSELKERL